MSFSLRSTFAAIAGGAIVITLGASADEPKAAPQPTPDKEGFVSLFDGKDLTGWKIGDNAESWSVKNGEIVVHGPGPAHLFYDGPIHNHDWKNFDLKAEVMTYPHANSGIYFHTTYQEKGWPDDGFEAQVNCTHTDWKKTGSLYDVVDIKDPHQEDNKWFLYEIIVKGDHVTLKIDNNVVNEWTQPANYEPTHGHKGRYLHHGTVALQGHDPGSEVHFKSVVIKPLDD